jgi:hypothetical protein
MSAQMGARAAGDWARQVGQQAVRLDLAQQRVVQRDEELRVVDALADAQLRVGLQHRVHHHQLDGLGLPGRARAAGPRVPHQARRMRAHLRRG